MQGRAARHVAHLGVELVVAEVQGGVDGAEGLEVDVHLLGVGASKGAS